METTKITVEVNVNADCQKTWNCYTQPEHITQWNFAADTWCCPRAENDLKAGGKYYARMEAKDGSFGFDFEATYDEVINEKKIAYTISDGRQATTLFEHKNGTTRVIITFDAENTNPVDMQRDGWLAILNSFKRYTETNS